MSTLHKPSISSGSADLSLDVQMPDCLRAYAVVFWDFDGVIKESVNIKTQAYVDLFAAFGTAFTTRVRHHHEQNGGMSRFEKIPLYLGWAGLQPTAVELGVYCNAFGTAVRQRIINCAWVRGAREYLAENHQRQAFVLVSATPEDEMKGIVEALAIGPWFREVHGAPQPKSRAVQSVLERWSCPAEKALFIGDSLSDWEAAAATGIGFLLRRTELNAELQRRYAGPQCEDFARG
jgi:phosphoglycolate phosphatase-like HAD superfamily hydrolase